MVARAQHHHREEPQKSADDDELLNRSALRERTAAHATLKGRGIVASQIDCGANRGAHKCGEEHPRLPIVERAGWPE